MQGHEEVLKSVGLRATKQRIAVLTILERQKGPVSVEELTRASKLAFDLATAYRTLDTFVEVGLARKMELAQGRALYERAGEHHHHAVCVECGTIADIEACLPPGIDKEVRRASGFSSITNHALEFFGVCAKCAV